MYAIKKLAPLPQFPNFPSNNEPDNPPIYPSIQPDQPDQPNQPNQPNKPNPPNPQPEPQPGGLTTPSLTAPPNTYQIEYIGNMDLTKLSTTPTIFNKLGGVELNDPNETPSINTLNVTIDIENSELKLPDTTSTYNIKISITINTSSDENQPTLPTSSTITLNTGISSNPNTITTIGTEDNSQNSGTTKIISTYENNNIRLPSSFYYYIYYTDNKNFDLIYKSATFFLNIFIQKV
jgi:hypothetical protein